MEAATTASTEQERAEQPASSFAKSLFCGEIHEEMVFPWPQPDEAEQERVRGLNRRRARDRRGIDPRELEEKRWIGDDLVRELGDAGLCGLYVPERYGGQGLSQTGYARVFETFAQIDATLSVVMGVHQSIGFKGIHLFGTDEQKERFLPDLAEGPQARGLRAHRARTRARTPTTSRAAAVQQPDGSWVLNGEKRYIGNGGKGSVFTTFARCEIDGKDSHIALILESGMKGFEVGERFDTMGLRANDLRRLLLQGRPGAAGERARRARRGLPDRDADPEQRADRPRHRLGRRDQGPARPGDRRTSRSGASSAIRWPTSSSSRTRSAGWSPTCSGSSRCAT